jgi:hypothetical protein
MVTACIAPTPLPLYSCQGSLTRDFQHPAKYLIGGKGARDPRKFAMLYVSDGYVTAIIFDITERVKTQRFFGCLLCYTFFLEYHYDTHVSVTGYCPTLSHSTSTARDQSGQMSSFYMYILLLLGIIMQWKTPRVRSTSLFIIFI